MLKFKKYLKFISVVLVLKFKKIAEWGILFVF